MKTLLCSLLTLLVGLILGGWGPNADLRRTKAELEQWKKQAHGRKSSAGLDGITSMLRIPEADKAERNAKNNAVTVTVSAGTNTPPAAPPPHRPRRHPGDDDEPQPDRQTLQERLKLASDLWKVRADLARSGFVSNVTTSTVQSSQFDLVVADMNLRLGSAIREWVDAIKEQKDFTPETGIRMMSALSSELVETYNQLDETMPTDWRAKAGDKFQVFDLIDPQVALPLTEVEGKMRLHSEARAQREQ